jgi:hypothetical protein
MGIKTRIRLKVDVSLVLASYFISGSSVAGSPPTVLSQCFAHGIDCATKLASSFHLLLPNHKP